MFFIFFISLFFFLAACTTESSDPDVVLFPKDRSLYGIFPNDPVLGDSIEAHLSTGIMMTVHPGGIYTISFDIDSTHEAPKMHLFRFYQRRDSNNRGMSTIDVLTPENRGNRYYYSFVCEENDMNEWGLTLIENDDYYKGKTSNIHFEGTGKYSNHLSLNLISVGKIDFSDEEINIDSLSKLLLRAFRNTYTSFVIDTIYVNHAEDHPTLGKNYPSDQYWYAGKSSESTDLSELGNWPTKGVTEALDIVLVHRIEEMNVLGFSRLFSANLIGGENSTVIVGTSVLTSSEERPLTINEIIKIALHETGHFFGLRHTTSTWADLEGYQDLSILEDGFEDTPSCPALLSTGLYKKGDASYLLHKKAFGPSFKEENCPDAELLMFPVSSDNTMRYLSKQELKFLKQSLMLIPH